MALFPSTPNDESRLMLTLSLLKVKSSWHGVWEVAALSLNSSSPHGLFTASTLRALIAAQLVGPQSSLSGGTDATATAKTADTPAALAMDPETPAREDQLLHSFLQLGGMRSLVVSLRDLRALLTDQEACRQLAASARRDHATLGAAGCKRWSGLAAARAATVCKWRRERAGSPPKSLKNGGAELQALVECWQRHLVEKQGWQRKAVAGQLLGVTPEEVWSALLHAAALPAWLLAPLPPHDLLPMAWDRALRVIQQNFKMHLAKKSWSKLRKVLQHQRQLLQGTSSQKGAQDPEEARQRDLEAGRRASDMLSASTPSDPSALLALGLEKYWEHSGSRHAGVAAAELLLATIQCNCHQCLGEY
ncbi:hypothetical protein HaLaN_20149 [Haematococcus lacustris]|uniref:Uncharacterized protein n=1 Tax=Haematococcus lacustris TaxID=44745 RepID=A0A6A0A160_HAELA|nr:hypothetical protein HaLaN_20149 [Haematococcus lacustris]